MSVKPRRCVRCGSCSVRPRKGDGRTRPYRVFAALALPDACMIPACHRCGAQYLDDETIAALGPVLERVYCAELQRIAALMLRRIPRRLISKRRLEMLLGLSQGYLSRIAAGDGVPSAPLVLLLGLIADAAPESIETLKRFWPSHSSQMEPEPMAGGEQ